MLFWVSGVWLYSNTLYYIYIDISDAFKNQAFYDMAHFYCLYTGLVWYLDPTLHPLWKNSCMMTNINFFKLKKTLFANNDQLRLTISQWP